MVARNVVKSLAVAEDILHGVGAVQQSRNGEALTLHRVDIPLGLASVTELSTVNPAINPRVRVGNIEFEYINSSWQERLVLAPYELVAGITLTARYNQVIKNGVLAAYTGAFPYVTTGLEDITLAPWQVLLSSGSSELLAPEFINVPADFATIHQAFESIQDKRIPTDKTCTIVVANGTYEFTSPLVLNHPDGLRLRLVGNETNELLCTLTIPVGGPFFDLIIASNGNSLGYINGFNISLTAKATNWTGLLAVNGAFIRCGNKITVNNFYYGIAARVGSEVICDYAKVYNAGDVGIWAYIGSTVSCNYAISNGAIDVTNNLGFGIQAEFGSSIECTGASASGCRIAGIAALSNGLVRAHNAIASNNLGSGFYASAEGHIEHHNAVANNNSRYGEERVLGGTIVGGSITLTGNTLGSSAGYAYFDNSGPLGARIAANGDLRIDVNGPNQVYFNSSGGVQSQITHVAASNSWTLQRASASNQPGVEAAGSAANIDYNVRAKGSGRVFVGSHLSNFLAVSGSLPGDGQTTLRPEGADANIDLLLRGKGGGLVRWGIHTSGSVTTNGYVEWKLEDGVIVRVAAQRL